MSKCKYLIDISPYDPLCDHPCRLYGGGAVEAECETCQYRIEDLERENEKLRKLVANYSAAAKYLCGFSHCNECNLDCASVFDDVPSGWDCARMLLDKRARELGIEVDE